MLRRAFSSLNSHFDAHTIRQELWKSYLRKTTSLNLCIKNKQLAERVTQVIGDQLLDQRKIVFEASPGSGLLTEQLLKNGTPKVRVFEHIETKLAKLASLKQSYGNRLEIVDIQILDLVNGNYKMLSYSRDDVIKRCFKGVPVQKNWSNHLQEGQEKIDSSIQFFTALSPFLAREFLTFIVYTLAHYDSFFNTGPTEFYLFVPLEHYKIISSKPSRNLRQYTAFTIQMNSLFDYSHIDLYSPQLAGLERVKIESNMVTFIPSEYFTFTNERTFKGKEDFIFLKIKPKELVQKCDAEFLMNYISFVKQSFIKPTNYAIRYYEKHFPGCAVELIGMGISYFKTLGDLTSDEMFHIFSHLYQTPYYEISIFKNNF